MSAAVASRESRYGRTRKLVYWTECARFELQEYSEYTRLVARDARGCVVLVEELQAGRRRNYCNSVTPSGTSATFPLHRRFVRSYPSIHPFSPTNIHDLVHIHLYINFLDYFRQPRLLPMFIGMHALAADHGAHGAHECEHVKPYFTPSPVDLVHSCPSRCSFTINRKIGLGRASSAISLASWSR